MDGSFVSMVVENGCDQIGLYYDMNEFKVVYIDKYLEQAINKNLEQLQITQIQYEVSGESMGDISKVNKYLEVPSE